MKNELLTSFFFLSSSMTEFRFYEGKEKGKKAKKRDGITIDIATI